MYISLQPYIAIPHCFQTSILLNFNPTDYNYCAVTIDVFCTACLPVFTHHVIQEILPCSHVV